MTEKSNSEKFDDITKLIAHIRRKFVDSDKTNDEKFNESIKQLFYDLEIVKLLVYKFYPFKEQLK